MNHYITPTIYFKEVSFSDFSSIYEKYKNEVFRDYPSLQIPLADAQETNWNINYFGNQRKNYYLILLLFDGEEPIGWFWGHQIETYEFIMGNTGIIPQYQKKGLYSKWLPKIIQLIQKNGFKTIRSRHNITNNRVLVPKLKFGFYISHVEISVTLGTLVHLTYFADENEKKAFLYRTGTILQADFLNDWND